MLLRTLPPDLRAEHEPAESNKQAAAWYEATMDEAHRLGIVSGRGDGTLGGNEPISRQDMAVMLYRAARLEAGMLREGNGGEAAPFADRSAVAGYAAEAVDALQRAGWIAGIGNGRFDPAGGVTRAQAAVLLWNALKSQ
ncbi:S-layer homology domain-containing protein [Cohnella rhizosphaerae]|uniref:S-layer homology domain-containing protein n=1 Tax=Cohnella rhizosphaerae TaxID=1457232 RepID=A0A9X4QXL3_9BACL|nr:S-layer homology domain-containing protein [Cohnella rhizosphaerae]MDG0814708.1 S-layer homology domain-containing protein [Cohnella rhizosphaerae]